MPDEIDRAVENAAFLLEARIKEQRGRVGYAHQLSVGAAHPTHCTDCGNHIPDARKKAVPGCQRCIGCQKELEEGR